MESGWSVHPAVMKTNVKFASIPSLGNALATVYGSG